MERFIVEHPLAVVNGEETKIEIVIRPNPDNKLEAEFDIMLNGKKVFARGWLSSGITNLELPIFMGPAIQPNMR